MVVKSVPHAKIYMLRLDGNLCVVVRVAITESELINDKG